MTKKKEYGQYFTSLIVAEFMVKWVMQKHPKQVLDPAVGEGIFLKLIHELCPETLLHACEIDPMMQERFLECNPYPVALYKGDYLFRPSEDVEEAIICNPPYLRFQKMEQRKEILEHLKNLTGKTLSGYTNAAAMFLVKCIHELKMGGRSAFILPYEFLNAGYGRQIKEYLLQEKALAAILLFDSRCAVFEDALTTSCILLLEKGSCNEVKFRTLDTMEELTDVSFTTKEKSYTYEALDCNTKWLSYFQEPKEAKQNLISLRSYAEVKRGIATGCNSYFTLTRAQAEELELTKEVLHPCIVKAPDVPMGILTNQILEHLIYDNKKMLLFDGMQAKTSSELAYLEKGVKLGVPKAYLTSHRHPWYTLEKAPAAPILFSVFSRNQIKIVRNETNARHLTAFHGIYLRPEYDSKEEANLLYCYLITPAAQEILRESHREYANGLDKFEPSDLQNAKILDLRLLSKEDRERVAKIYEKMRRIMDETQGKSTQAKRERVYVQSVEALNVIFSEYVERKS